MNNRTFNELARRTGGKGRGGHPRPCAASCETTPEGERGCMVSTGTVQSGAEHAEVAHDLAAGRRPIPDAVAREFGGRLEMPAAVAMAEHVVTVMQGLAVQARDGTSRTELKRLVDEVAAGIKARQPTSLRNSPHR